MYVIRYEKDSLKDYILYDISNNLLPNIIQCDNGFQQVYLNINNISIRLHLKIIVYNRTLHNCIEQLYDFLNKRFNTANEDWSICINEKVIDSKYRISFLFYSNKYSITLGSLKNLVEELYHPLLIFDDSIYYRKYKSFIITELPNQSNYAKKHYDTYRMLQGNIFSVLVEQLQNLEELDLL